MNKRPASFTSQRLSLEVRREKVGVIATTRGAGISRRQSCELLQIHIRRIERWERRLHNTGTLQQYAQPGPKQALHAIMPQEQAALLSFAGAEETVDYLISLIGE